MTQEEKAKAYDKALERARAIINDYEERGLEEILFYAKEDLGGIFPELKESEDEKIRKAIIYGLKYLERELSWDALDDVDILDAYDWLEKQGEKKPIIEMKSAEESLGISSKEYNEIVNDCLYGKSSPTDIVEPKFKESEDERIRKALVRFHKSTIDIDGIKGEQIVAWLEKQGEKKEVDLEKEFDDYTKDIMACDVQFEPFTHLYNCAKHFFEIGLKVAQKGGIKL